jgi:hypothetical protein
MSAHFNIRNKISSLMTISFDAFKTCCVFHDQIIVLFVLFQYSVQRQIK